MNKDKTITIKATIVAPVEKVWNYYTEPTHITQWNFASDEWCCPSARNEIKAGGKLSWRMEAKDGSAGFDFTGTYSEVRSQELLTYTLDDNRQVKVTFSTQDEATTVVIDFEIEDMHSAEMQKNGWQAILNNFKKHVETQND